MAKKDGPKVLLAMAGLLAIPLLPLALFRFGWLDEVLRGWDWVANGLGWQGIAIALTVLLVGSIGIFLSLQPKGERSPLAVIFVLAIIGNIGFWTAFEQAGSSMNVFAAQSTDRPFPLPDWIRDFLRDGGIATLIGSLLGGGVLFLPLVARFRGLIPSKFLIRASAWVSAALGLGLLGIGIAKIVGRFGEGSPLDALADMTIFPATWYQSVNALTIIICAPIFSWLWLYLARRRREPSTPMKFAIGLWFLGLAFLAMVAGAWEARSGGLAGPQWLAITFIVYTWGELCLSPVGLSMVTKLAPKHLQSLMMGLWWFTFALSNLCAGLVARLSTKFVVQDGADKAEMSFIIDGQPGFYLMLVVFPIGVGVVIWMLSPMLKKMMQGKG